MGGRIRMGIAARRGIVAGLVAFAGVATTALVPPVLAGTDALSPAVRITAPDEAHTFEPGDELITEGTASAPRNVLAVKLEYWLLNRLERRVLADCTGCGTPAATWTDRPSELKAGYFVLKAYAVDQRGVQSDPVSRGFVSGLQNVPKPQPPQPTVPTVPKIPAPVIGDPKPGRLLPGAEVPIPVSGGARPGSTVTVYEREIGLGPLGTARADNRGRWTMLVRLPSGHYTITAQAVDQAGRKSALAKLVGFTVDADRPQVTLPSEEVLVFPPTDPVMLEGAVFDERGAAVIVVEYWLLDKLALRHLAQCPGCGAQRAVWWSSPVQLKPAYYHVKVKAFDSAGNPSWVSTIGVVKTNVD